MGSEERYLWLCEFHLHGEARMWWGYFRDEEEVEAFFRTIIEMLPCIVFDRLEELESGMRAGDIYFPCCLSDYVRAEDERRCRTGKPRTVFGQPAPLRRGLLASFLRDLPPQLFCGECARMIPALRAILARPRSGRQRVRRSKLPAPRALMAAAARC